MPESPRVIRVRVECYAGYRGEETPRFMSIGESRLEVTTVLDRWLAPDHRYFKVRTRDEDTYILRQELENGEWEVAFYQQKAR